MLSAPVTVTSPVKEPVTLDQVKTFLRVDGSALDGELELLIAAAREDLELATGQRLIDQVVLVVADHLADLGHLTVGPVQAINALRYRPADSDEIAIGDDGFELVGAGLEQAIVPTRLWPRSATGCRLSVRLAVGYGPTAADVPASLRLILLQLIRGRFEEKPVDLGQLIVNQRIFA